MIHFLAMKTTTEMKEGTVYVFCGGINIHCVIFFTAPFFIVIMTSFHHTSYPCLGSIPVKSIFSSFLCRFAYTCLSGPISSFLLTAIHLGLGRQLYANRTRVYFFYGAIRHEERIKVSERAHRRYSSALSRCDRHEERPELYSGHSRLDDSLS